MMREKLVQGSVFFVLLLTLASGLSACSSGLEVKEQAYAKLKDNRVYEYEFPVVWKAIESAFRNYKITDRDPADADPVALRKMRKRTLETDWVQTQSHDKYVEFKVNDIPQKRYLWTRVKFKVIAERALGGTQVTIRTQEQVEHLNADGSSAGYESVDEIDSSRPNEMLDRIQNAILSAAP
jgi:hypothetical protein